ncbi:flippase-like domain-containing protein [Candidatus Pacearchaeota archaeon]|nr:flippase-like domain-containing protein [Candidatus Pacearchaeota archaeon]
MKHWKRLFPIIGIALFIYILINIDLTEVYGEIKNADLFYIFLAFVLLIIMLVVQTFKWYLVAVYQNITIPFRKAFEINLITNFYGFVTPSKAGGIVRAEYLREYTHDKNIGKGLFNFTIDKILDTLSLIFLVIFFSFVFQDTLDIPLGTIVLFFIAFLIGIFIFMNKENSKYFLRFFYHRFIGKKYQNIAKLTFDSFYENVPKKRYLFLFFILNIVSWLLVYGIIYVIGLSLGIELHFIYYLAILPIGTMVAILPISISGLGTREAALIALFGLFGVEAAKVFSMSLINLFIVGVIPSIIGIFLVMRKNKG